MYTLVDWDSLERERQRPQGRPAMTQKWKDLVFLHAEADPEWIQSLLPPGLTVDTFDGIAYIGIICFEMRDVQPRLVPTVGGWRNFLETNLRTYVNHPVHGPGVWFFSLDASTYLPCLVARVGFDLPYYHCEMHSKLSKENLHYQGTRKSSQLLPKVWSQGPALETYDLSVDLPDIVQPVERETLSFWLHERYRFYSANPDGRLKTAKVFHKPYEVAEASIHANHLLIDSDQTFEFKIQTIAKTVEIEAFSPYLV